MYTVNIKKRFGISIVLAAMLLSGCQAKSESSLGDDTGILSSQSDISSSVPTESSVASSAQPADSSSVVSSEQPEESFDFSLPEEPPYSEPPNPFPADRVYPDDELVPSEWIRVNTSAETREKIDEVLKSDTSVKDPEIAIPALINKHVLCFDIFYNSLIPTNWDAPYNSTKFQNPIYPFKSDYFPNLQSIHDLVYATYEGSTAERLFYGYNGEPLYTEINGKMYKNAMVFPNRSSNPFAARSYIEIFGKTENKCAFTWYYPSIDYHEDDYNQPESGYEFFYLEKNYFAEYINGSWKLERIVIDGE